MITNHKYDVFYNDYINSLSFKFRYTEDDILNVCCPATIYTLVRFKDGRKIMLNSFLWEIVDIPYPDNYRLSKEEFNKELRFRIKDNVSLRFMFQEEFADKMNVSQGTISHWYNGVTNIDIYTLIKMARFLRRPIEDFIYRDTPQYDDDIIMTNDCILYPEYPGRNRKYFYDNKLYEKEYEIEPDEDLYYKKLGKRINYYMWYYRYNQKTLGEELEIKQSTISRWIKGSRAPSIYELYRMSDLFNIPFKKLVYDI